MELAKIQRERAVDAVYQALRQAIVSSLMKPGERLNVEELAGKLGVALTDALIQQGVLEAAGKDFTLTGHSHAMLKDLGVNVAVVAKQRRAFARRCLDWTERRDHLGGALGAGEP